MYRDDEDIYMFTKDLRISWKYLYFEKIHCSYNRIDVKNLFGNRFKDQEIDIEM